MSSPATPVSESGQLMESGHTKTVTTMKATSTPSRRLFQSSQRAAFCPHRLETSRDKILAPPALSSEFPSLPLQLETLDGNRHNPVRRGARRSSTQRQHHSLARR